MSKSNSIILLISLLLFLAGCTSPLIKKTTKFTTGPAGQGEQVALNLQAQESANEEGGQPSEISCGPKHGGEKYDLMHCNRSCNVDADCLYTCGCGAINADETCHDDGAMYGCVDSVVQCMNNRCEIVSENIPACIKEGEYVDHFDKDSFECCPGLIKVSSLPLDDNCEFVLPENSPGPEPGWACIRCSDDICGAKYENKCNCPEDCQ